MKAINYIKQHSGEIILSVITISFAVLAIVMVIGYENMNRL